METTKTIYTIGHLPMLDFEVFINNIMKYEIRFVVDIRNQPDLAIYGEFRSITLQNKLKECGITYLPFQNEFCSFENTINKQSGLIYDKAVSSLCFLKGIKRLNNGVEKGLQIVLLGESISPSECKRCTLIGRYLHSIGWNVYHIVNDPHTNGTTKVIPQSTINEILKERKVMRIEKKHKALQLGASGEEIAAQYLMDNGYTILDRNWNLHRGCELDIIAFKDYVIHAIEVKTRMCNVEIEPERAIDINKLKNINTALSEYRYRNDITTIPYQIDSIAIVMKENGEYTLNMYENIIRHTSFFYH